MNMDCLYREIEEAVAADKEEIFAFGRRLFDCPETGFREVESNGILTSFLRDNGIPCRNDVALTGIRADLGEEGGYRIALVADLDALLVRDENGERPFHSCGHSIQATVLAWAMKLLKKLDIPRRLGGRVSFIAAPAEELIELDYREGLRKQGKLCCLSGKQEMIARGEFNDIDCVLNLHINGDHSPLLFDVGSTLAGFSMKRVTFHGTSAHSGAAPQLGRNAQDGAGLFLTALAYLKSRFSAADGVQIHPVITSVSGGVNIIPDQAVLESYVRANTLPVLLDACGQFDRAAEHCAKALGLGCEVETRTGYMPLHQSEKLNRVIERHMREICGEEQIVKHVVSGASGDVGDLGYLLPTVQFGFTGMEGRIHSSRFEIVDEENAYLHTMLVVLKTVADLLAYPELRPDRAGYEERLAFYKKHWLMEPDQ